MTQLSRNFTLEEFLTTSMPFENDFRKIPGENAPVIQTNLTLLCDLVLQPARNFLDTPIRVTSGYRSEKVNKEVGGVFFSQHRNGLAADITCDTAHFPKLVEFLRYNKHVDQLLTASNWLHVSIAVTNPRHHVVIGYYNSDRGTSCTA